MMIPLGLALLGMSSCSPEQKWTERQVEDFMIVSQEDGPTLGYSPKSGVKLLTVDGFAFKDLNRNDSLDVYEDWRLSAQERAADLASKLSLEEMKTGASLLRSVLPTWPRNSPWRRSLV